MNEFESALIEALKKDSRVAKIIAILEGWRADEPVENPYDDASELVRLCGDRQLLLGFPSAIAYTVIVILKSSRHTGVQWECTHVLNSLMRKHGVVLTKRAITEVVKCYLESTYIVAALGMLDVLRGSKNDEVLAWVRLDRQETEAQLARAGGTKQLQLLEKQRLGQERTIERKIAPLVEVSRARIADLTRQVGACGTSPEQRGLARELAADIQHLEREIEDKFPRNVPEERRELARLKGQINHLAGLVQRGQRLASAEEALS